jgi:ubiquitin-conjugating enzyme E2 O
MLDPCLEVRVAKLINCSAKNSSLLQVFVSISGLVLVRHPYHCEPAFAKLEGTREGRVNS